MLKVNKWKKIYPLTGKLNIKTISYGTKLICSFNAIPIKSTMVFFCGTYMTLKLIWKDNCRKNQDTTRGNLQIQQNSYQITNGIFCRYGTKNLKVCRKHKNLD